MTLTKGRLMREVEITSANNEIEVTGEGTAALDVGTFYLDDKSTDAVSLEEEIEQALEALTGDNWTVDLNANGYVAMSQNSGGTITIDFDHANTTFPIAMIGATVDLAVTGSSTVCPNLPGAIWRPYRYLSGDPGDTNEHTTKDISLAVALGGQQYVQELSTRTNRTLSWSMIEKQYIFPDANYPNEDLHTFWDEAMSLGKIIKWDPNDASRTAGTAYVLRSQTQMEDFYAVIDRSHIGPELYTVRLELADYVS